MMKRTLAALAMVAAAVGCSTYRGMSDQDALQKLVWQQSGAQRVAWEHRDASMLYGSASDAAIVATENGKQLTKSEAIAAAKEEMANLVSVSELTEHVDNVKIDGNDAEVTTTARFVAKFKDPSGQERTRVSSGQNRQHFKRSATGEWSAAWPVEIVSHDTKWDDKAPKQAALR